MSSLGEYLTQNNIRQAEFAARVGLSQSMVSKLANRMVAPSLDMAVRIARATDGAVSVDTWISDTAFPGSFDGDREGAV